MTPQKNPAQEGGSCAGHQHYEMYFIY